MKYIILCLLCLMVAPCFSAAKKYNPVRESWNYVVPMKKFSTLFKGTEGVVIHMGDHNTYTSHNTRWVNYFQWGQQAHNYIAEDTTIMTWSHAGKEKSNLNGWYLASVDAAEGRSETAATGVTTEQYIQGGYKGLLSAEAIMKKYNPQIVILMLGSADGRAHVDPKVVSDNIDTLIVMMLKNGTIPVLSTIPPSTEYNAEQYNKLYRKLAKKRGIPMIDLHRDMMILAKNDWRSKMIADDGVHLTHELSAEAPTIENISKCGYLLRCYLAVEKLKIIHEHILN